MAMEFGPRRGVHVDLSREMAAGGGPLETGHLEHLETFDLIYRSLCAVLYNFVPMSGHPGGSISSGRFVTGLLFGAMDYDPSDPERPDADLISYAAGHKALGLYAMWALRNEILRLGAPELLPERIEDQLRLEDLLGFRRNPVTDTPLFRRFQSKPLDGHPTPATPFLKLSTGASGIGLAASLGLAFGARDYWGEGAPRVHIIEGEGGMTPGRVSEAMAAAGTAPLGNVVLHVDWNQASIDSNRVCREGDRPGDYVQWDPAELAYLHDWNVISVADGHDLQSVYAAQARAAGMDNGQPTAVIYRTTKGWHYGIEGKASHGAGHKICSEGYFKALEPLTSRYGLDLSGCGEGEAGREESFWKTLLALRGILEREEAMVAELAGRLSEARRRLDDRECSPRDAAPDLQAFFRAVDEATAEPPSTLKLETGGSSTLRAALGDTLAWYNQRSGGAVLAAAADLLGSTSVLSAGKDFPQGFYNSRSNPESRILSVGGICEDGICGVLAGVSSYGRHLGVGSSYGAFIASLGHISARLHAIGVQAFKERLPDRLAAPFVLICAHVGMKTGEDGPTHADPQSLQLLQGNFPAGSLVTLTPWDPRELWPLLTTALQARPAVIAPFVTRPGEKILDREAMGLAPVPAAVEGLYRLRPARGSGDGTLLLQGSGVAYAFLEETLPLLEAEGIDLDVYYLASAELFDALPSARREEIYSEERAAAAMGITGFTLPTLDRWVTSRKGREASLHPFRGGHFLGSGQADKVISQAGMDGRSQFEAIRGFLG